MPRTSPTPATELERDLRAAIEGEVRFDAGTRAIYATDSSNYRQVPVGVLIPRTIDDVVAAVAVCRTHGAAVLSRGGGTSLAGQCCNVAVVIDFSRYLDRVVEIDRDARLARVEPGCVLDTLRAAAERGEPSLTFGPDPATHAVCTLGGMIGNNSCGVHSVLSEFHGPGPRTSDNVDSLEVLTYDGVRMRVNPTTEQELEVIVGEGGRRGEIYRRLRDLRDRYAGLIRERFPKLPRRVSGYNLDELLPERGFNVARALVGTEGTCVTVLEATVALVAPPAGRTLVALGFEDLYAAAAAVPLVREHAPVALEGFDRELVEANATVGRNRDGMERLPSGQGWLLVEVGGEDRRASDAVARAMIDRVAREGGLVDHRLYDDPAAEAAVWRLRDSGLSVPSFLPGEPDRWPGWEDSAVPPEAVAPYLRDLRALFDRYGYRAAIYGHLGQGCVHCRISFDLRSAEGTKRMRAFLDEAADLVVGYGGSLSGEHGDGQGLAELLPRMYGPELVEAFREFKSIWDPEGKMNPGKIVDPYPITTNLRLGAGAAAPKAVSTHFAYLDDGGDFAHAATRCVGVGKCRRVDGGVMCPSFMVTRDEEHTTRGRARILFEMMRGEEIDPWRSPEVKRALDLCLSCKACKSDCPVGVDMATYKAEFLAHYYEDGTRPRAAYAMGLINRWARLGSHAPGLANRLAPGLKRLAGIASERNVPRIAEESFRSWFGRRRPNAGRAQVLLWVDTFTDYFHPEVAKATVEVLEAAGYRVRIPSADLCCGRPLYEYGMLDRAKATLQKAFDALGPVIEAGAPVIGIEPSCVAVFRDEAPNLFPHDDRAARLARQTKTLAEFLVEVGWRPPKLPGIPAVIQAHCHDRAITGFSAEGVILDALGLDYQIPEPGCCGMAGSFGFEAGEKYRLSTAIGERNLFPRVREAPDDALIVADGFSCRTQVEQGTGRKALHLAEVLRIAIRGAES